MSIGELKVDLGFDVDNLKLNQFIKDLGELNLSAVIAAAGFKEIVDGLKDIMESADRTISSLNKLSGITGVQAGVFQQWDNTAQQFNVTAGVTNQAISDIQKNIQLAKIGQGNLAQAASVFGPLGVIFQGRENDPQGVLHDILKSLEGMDAPTRRLYLHAAGFNEELSLMVGHEDEIFSQTKNTVEQTKILADYHKQIVKLSNDWMVLINGIAAALAPIFTPMLRILDALIDGFIQLEEITPRWVQDILAAVVLFGILNGLAKTFIGLFIGSGIAKALVPLIGDVALLASRLYPILAIAGGLAIGASTLYEMLRPKDNSTTSVDNSGDFNQNNTYNIQGNDPNSITQRIQELHQGQLRDAQSQSQLVNW